MTTMELESRKALLVREILTNVNDEETLSQLNGFLQRLKKDNASSQTISSDLLNDLMNMAEQQDKAGLCINSDELKSEMNTW